MWLGFGAKAGGEQLVPHPSEGGESPKTHYAQYDDEDDQFRSHGDCHDYTKSSV
jgi:hypothetical protein